VARLRELSRRTIRNSHDSEATIPSRRHIGKLLQDTTALGDYLAAASRDLVSSQEFERPRTRK